MKVFEAFSLSNQVDISIIIPVYNVQEFVVRCLDSVFDQEFKGIFEVIVVEDCSTDQSRSVLRSYKKSRPELVIIEHEKNRRLAGARTSGMRAAKGTYVMHVDADDWLLPNCLEDIFQKCCSTNADVLVFNYLTEDKRGSRTFPQLIKEELICNDILKVQELFFGSCWTKIVRRELLSDMIYSSCPAPRSTEDLIYCTEILLRAKSVCLFPMNCYVYYQNETSISNSTGALRYIKNQILILETLGKIFNRYNVGSSFRKNVLDYFERWVYLALCKIHFLNNKDYAMTSGVFELMLDSSVIDPIRANRFRRALDCRYMALFELIRRFGPKFSLGFIYRVLNK